MEFKLARSFMALTIFWSGILLGVQGQEAEAVDAEIEIRKATGEEPLCIYSLAYRLLHRAGFKAVELEPTIYVDRSVNSPQGIANYVLFGTIGTSQKVKAMITAAYSAEAGGLCLPESASLIQPDHQVFFYLTLDSPHRVLPPLSRIYGVQMSGKIDPHLETRPKGLEDTDFEAEREWGKQGNSDPEAAPNRPVRSTQVVFAASDFMLLQSLRTMRARNPAASPLSQMARKATGFVLWGDLAARGYYSLVRKTDPGDIGVWTGAKGMLRSLDKAGSLKDTMKVSEVGLKRVQSAIDLEEENRNKAHQQNLQNNIALFMTPKGVPRADVKKMRIRDGILFQADRNLYWQAAGQLQRVSSEMGESRSWFSVDKDGHVYVIRVRVSGLFAVSEIVTEKTFFERTLTLNEVRRPESLGDDWDVFQLGRLAFIWSKRAGSLLSIECTGLPRELVVSFKPINRKVIAAVEPVEVDDWIVDLKLTYKDKTSQRLSELLKEILNPPAE